MTESQIKKQILKYHWDPWLKRPFFGFIMSTFGGGTTKKIFKKIGFDGWSYDFIFSNGQWYQAEEVYQNNKKLVLRWLKLHSIAEVNDRLENSHIGWKKEITLMSENPSRDTLKKLKRLNEILREIGTYVWVTHVLEHFFTPLLKSEVSKIKKTDVEKFIGDAAYPSKLNAAEQMVEEYRIGTNPKILAKKYGWMRARDGFARPYTAKELIDFAKHSLAQPKHKHPNIPKNLEKIFNEARELVYLRMYRMDIYYELMFLAKPVLKAAGKKYKIPYPKLKYYTLGSLIKGKPKYYPPNTSYAEFKEKFYFFEGSLFNQVSSGNIREIRGNIAQMGFAKGIVKIVMSVKDLPKVKKGDILVTYMTSPNFLPAMKLASAFITDEGGLTCHAAIVAREMGKPCIIGTKIATKVFKDGDFIEVNANTGMVKKIK